VNDLALRSGTTYATPAAEDCEVARIMLAGESGPWSAVTATEDLGFFLVPVTVAIPLREKTAGPRTPSAPSPEMLKAPFAATAVVVARDTAAGGHCGVAADAGMAGGAGPQSVAVVGRDGGRAGRGVGFAQLDRRAVRLRGLGGRRAGDQARGDPGPGARGAEQQRPPVKAPCGGGWLTTGLTSWS
jgi:hypothetical protein